MESTQEQEYLAIGSMVVGSSGMCRVTERQTDTDMVYIGVSGLDKRHRDNERRQDGDGGPVPPCVRRDAL